MHHDGIAGKPIPLTELEARVCTRIWQDVLGAQAVAQGSHYPWPPESLDVCMAHAACHGYLPPVKEGETPETAFLLADGSRVSQRHLQIGPRARMWISTACVAGRGFDDLFDGDPAGLPTGALRRGSQWMAAFLPPVPDEIGLATGVLMTLAVAREQMSFEAALEITRKIIGGLDRQSPAALRLIDGLRTEIVRDLAPRLREEEERRRTGYTNNSLSFYMAGNTEARLGAYRAFLQPHLVEIEALAASTEAGIAAILARDLKLLPDPSSPEDKAGLGVALYGLTLFGDTGARHF